MKRGEVRVCVQAVCMKWAKVLDWVWDKCMKSAEVRVWVWDECLEWAEVRDWRMNMGKPTMWAIG